MAARLLNTSVPLLLVSGFWYWKEPTGNAVPDRTNLEVPAASQVFGSRFSKYSRALRVRVPCSPEQAELPDETGECKGLAKKAHGEAGCT